MATYLHDILVAGSLKYGGTWGGPECRANVDINTHFYESAFWISICIISYKLLNFGKKLSTLRTTAKFELTLLKYANCSRKVDKILATIHFGTFLLLIYYKWNISSLISLIQPCHLVLLFEGIALASDGPLGLLITSLILPTLSGTFLAILFPDTTGLDQYLEMEFYWFQHYLIILVPIYLLQRRNSLAIEMCSVFTVSFGLCILTFLHFSLYEGIDLLLNVNVEFMLCPTGAMNSIFGQFPPWLLFPSYRSVMVVLVCIVGSFMAHCYVKISKNVLFLQKLLSDIKNGTFNSITDLELKIK
mmetsp:Transcript_8691/g.8629  ORF Transcript_8691/g.8629 Transcript_8691/m.8629 type:complete len:302 (+) Transcript_8691:72-977(+)